MEMRSERHAAVYLLSVHPLVILVSDGPQGVGQSARAARGRGTEMVIARLLAIVALVCVADLSTAQAQQGAPPPAVLV